MARGTVKWRSLDYTILAEHAADRNNTGAWKALERCAEIRGAGGVAEIESNENASMYRVRDRNDPDGWKTYFRMTMP